VGYANAGGNGIGGFGSKLGMITAVTNVETVVDNPMKLVRYDPEELTGLKAFGHIPTSIFMSRSVWRNMFFIISLAMFVACCVFLLTPDPKASDFQKMKDAASFFKVFIAFMLGLYVSASYQRYNTLIQEVTALFSAVKQIQTDMINLGVDRELRRTIERYSLTSCRLLHVEMLWIFEPATAKLPEWRTKLQEYERLGYLYTDECATLLDAIGRSG